MVKLPRTSTFTSALTRRRRYGRPVAAQQDQSQEVHDPTDPIGSAFENMVSGYVQNKKQAAMQDPNNIPAEMKGLKLSSLTRDQYGNYSPKYDAKAGQTQQNRLLQNSIFKSMMDDLKGDEPTKDQEAQQFKPGVPAKKGNPGVFGIGASEDEPAKPGAFDPNATYGAGDQFYKDGMLHQVTGFDPHSGEMNVEPVLSDALTKRTLRQKLRKVAAKDGLSDATDEANQQSDEDEDGQ